MLTQFKFDTVYHQLNQSSATKFFYLQTEAFDGGMRMMKSVQPGQKKRVECDKRNEFKANVY